MQPLSKMPLRDLLRRREVLERELELAAPSLWPEWKLIQGLIDNYGQSETTSVYANIPYPREVIPLCLKRNHAWMTRKQILQDLEHGGFTIPDPKRIPALVTDSLRYHSKVGNIIRRNDDGTPLKPGDYKAFTRFPNEQFGLPEWAGDASVPVYSEKYAK